MPELPEVETTVRGISPHVCGATITGAVVRDPRLRWPVPNDLADIVTGRTVDRITRRAKYMLFAIGQGHMLIHLGMSGSLRLSPFDELPGRHDHVEFTIDDNWRLRLRDPRRFGCVLWINEALNEHRLLANLGVEPLSKEFNGDYLYQQSRSRKLAVKNYLMDSRLVVGIGNIYASESLFRAGIHPLRSAGRISKHRYRTLADCVQSTLQDAIAAGGTTLRDFVSGASEPGYFAQELLVYDRAGDSCVRCGSAIVRIVIGQRASYYCKKCQR